MASRKQALYQVYLLDRAHSHILTICLGERESYFLLLNIVSNIVTHWNHFERFKKILVTWPHPTPNKSENLWGTNIF